jgi:hypothetical protein
MISTLVLLAQFAGGGAVQPIAAELPTCGPALEYGTVCVWRGHGVLVPSVQDPSRTILVSIQTTEPERDPGANPNLFLRHGHFEVTMEYGLAPSCSDVETYTYLLDIGMSCPLPGSPAH